MTANGEMLLNVTEKDIFEGKKVTTGPGVRITWFNPENLTPSNSIKNSIAFIRDSCDIWAKNKYYQAIPTDDGKVGQVLVCDENGRGRWGDLNMEDYYSYGVEWNNETFFEELTYIGNKKLYDSHPIEKSFQPCIYNTQNKGVKYWLISAEDDNGNYTTIDGETKTLDTNDVIMIHTPTFYGNYSGTNNKIQVRVSLYRLNYNWFEIPEMFISAKWEDSASSIIDNISFNYLPYAYYIWIFYWLRLINGNLIVKNKNNDIYYYKYPDTSGTSGELKDPWLGFDIYRYSDQWRDYTVINGLKVTLDSNKLNLTFDKFNFTEFLNLSDRIDSLLYFRVFSSANNYKYGELVKNSIKGTSNKHTFRFKQQTTPNLNFNNPFNIGIYTSVGFYLETTSTTNGNHRYYILAN